MIDYTDNQEIRRSFPKAIGAVVDIDGTLGDYAPLLEEECLKISPGSPGRDKWDKWEVWDLYAPHMTKEQFYNEAIIKAHERMAEMAVIPGARELLQALHDMDYTVTIGTHRDGRFWDLTHQWLEENDLPYDYLHLSGDKSVLFQPCVHEYCAIVVDDSPIVVAKADERVDTICVPAQPWNKDIALESGRPLFRGDLHQIREHLGAHE